MLKGYGFAPETILRFIDPLYMRPDETLYERFRNVDWIIRYFNLQLGAPLEKMMLGVPLGGNSYKIFPGQNQLGQAVKGPGIAGNVTRWNFKFNLKIICRT
jgi:hypothetical protein